jgi:hypothetical protein
MEMNGSKHTIGAVVALEMPLANIDQTASAGTSRREQTEVSMRRSVAAG